MLDVDVIEDPAAAVVALDPVRARLLAALAQPGSAATLAGQLGLTRQKINYHLHALEAHGLIRLAGERRWGGLTERLFVATAASYVISPAALGAAASDPARASDRLSARYLIALPHPGRHRPVISRGTRTSNAEQQLSGRVPDLRADLGPCRGHPGQGHPRNRGALRSRSTQI
jgi:DNA-binding transcriptional ArsR family regulator